MSERYCIEEVEVYSTSTGPKLMHFLILDGPVQIAECFTLETAERMIKALDILDKIDALPYGSGKMIGFVARGPTPRGKPSFYQDDNERPYDPTDIEWSGETDW